MKEISNNQILLWLAYEEIVPQKLNSLLENCEPSYIWQNIDADVRIKDFLGEDKCNRLKLNRRMDYILGLEQQLESYDVKYITVFDKEFPTMLKQHEVECAPLLFYKGNVSLLKTNCLAIVGTRQATAYGKNVCKDFSYQIAKGGITIVSGLALGSDTVAHEAALEAGGNTIAVIAGGLNHITPSYNHALARQIAQNGLLISESVPHRMPTKYMYPQRNRIISGLCKATLIVEAPEKSGALITASYALEQSREVFAICGNINNVYSKGTNNLIKRSLATIVTEPEDILTYYDIKQQSQEKSGEIMLDFFEEKLYNLIGAGAVSFDSLLEESGLGAQALNQTLFRMELKGLVKKLPQNHYSL